MPMDCSKRCVCAGTLAILAVLCLFSGLFLQLGDFNGGEAVADAARDGLNLVIPGATIGVGALLGAGAIGATGSQAKHKKINWALLLLMVGGALFTLFSSHMGINLSCISVAAVGVTMASAGAGFVYLSIDDAMTTNAWEKENVGSETGGQQIMNGVELKTLDNDNGPQPWDPRAVVTTEQFKSDVDPLSGKEIIESQPRTSNATQPVPAEEAPKQDQVPAEEAPKQDQQTQMPNTYKASAGGYYGFSRTCKHKWQAHPLGNQQCTKCFAIKEDTERRRRLATPMRRLTEEINAAA